MKVIKLFTNAKYSSFKMVNFSKSMLISLLSHSHNIFSSTLKQLLKRKVKPPMYFLDSYYNDTHPFELTEHV